MASNPKGSFNHDVSDIVTVQSHGAHDWFAKMPTAQAALEFASSRHANLADRFDAELCRLLGA